MFVVLRTSCLVFIPKFGTIINLPFSSVFHWLYFDVQEGFHRSPECFIIIYIIQVKVFVITSFSFSKPADT